MYDLVTNQQNSWKKLEFLANNWQESLKKRTKQFFENTLQSLELIQQETAKIDSNFKKLSQLKIEPKWGFIYPKVEDYFDKEAIQQFGVNLKKQSINLKNKVAIRDLIKTL